MTRLTWKALEQTANTWQGQPANIKWHVVKGTSEAHTALYAGALHSRSSHSQDALAAERVHNQRQTPWADNGLPTLACMLGGCATEQSYVQVS